MFRPLYLQKQKDGRTSQYVRAFHKTATFLSSAGNRSPISLSSSPYLTQQTHSGWARIAQPIQRLARGWMIRESNPGEGEIFPTTPDRNQSSRSLLQNEYRVSFPGVTRPERDVDHPPSTAEVKERVELYLYSPSGPVRGCNLLTYTGVSKPHAVQTNEFETQGGPHVALRNKN